MTIKTFEIEYDAINSKNIFTRGDVVNGRIIVETSKETKVQSLLFIGKGKGRVCWSENYGNDNHQVFIAEEKYYSIKHHILRKSADDGSQVIGKGRHVFPFTFQIPDRKMPSTFKSSIGKIVHKLKAELKQSMRLTKKAKAHFTFMSDVNAPGLMEAQHQFKDKSLAFGSGDVSMDVFTTKLGYKPGEDLQVALDINNRSSRAVKPKFKLYEKLSYFAQGRRKVQTNHILKGKLGTVSSGKIPVNKVITIPGVPESILNCSILKREYRLKVYLDIKCAVNPHIKFPIVILPEFPRSVRPHFSSAIGFEPFGNQMQPTQVTTPQNMDPPPPYGACAAYPLYDSEPCHISNL